MKLSVVLAVLVGSLVLACSTAAPAPAEPTPNIDATVEARVAQERAVDATVEARAKELVAEQPTATPYPTYTPVPTATLPPKPTNTPAPQRINTPEPTPTDTPTLATSVPTPTPRPIATAVPTPTAIPTPVPTPNPLQVELVISKAVDWNYRNQDDYLYNCYDLKANNTDNVPIDLSYSLTALDNDDVTYPSGWAHIQSLDGYIHHLIPGQTYYDKRCWGGGGTGPTSPVTRMELSIDELTESTIHGNDVGVGEWQKIGEGGNLEQYVKFIDEPEFPIGYPEETYGMRWTQWEVANTSETKTLHVRSCVAWLWRESSMYGQYQNGVSLALIAQDIKADTLFSNICRDSRISPKTTGKLDTNTSPAANGWLYPNLYEKILGVWVREE